VTHQASAATGPAGAREVERWLHALYVAVEGAALRDEDRRKARQVAAMLGEVARAARHVSRRDELVLVDAAAGKSFVGLLAAKLVLEPLGRPARVITLERDPRRVAAAEVALARLGTTVRVECRVADVSVPAQWPAGASVVVALHACGAAADAVIDRAIECRARALLLVPCCTSRAIAAAARAEEDARARGIPRHAPVRRRYVQALVDAERTLRLEAAGFQTEVVEFVGATLTPHNLLWRAREVGEPVRAAEALQALAAWAGARGGGTTRGTLSASRPGGPASPAPRPAGSESP
jgi:hypothetical protein